ncbi:MAG: 16S rRNA (guanine(527)-N(7))-methyltransferase RsmG [Planctomycetota bacterium]
MTDETAADAEFHATTLAEAIAAFGLAIPESAVEPLDAYRRSLWAWNEKLNLTRHTTLEKFVTRDLVDTLALAEHLPEGETVLDVGSGGGVPGVPLAILRPDLNVSLCESVAKKAKALTAIVGETGLSTPIYAARLEKLLEAERFDTLIARAVAPLWKFMFWLRPLGPRYGRLLLIKGPGWVDERGEARHRGYSKPYTLRRVAEYDTPRTSAVSTILSLCHTKLDGKSPDHSGPSDSQHKGSMHEGRVKRRR